MVSTIEEYNVKINIVQITSKTRLELALMYYLCHDLVNLLLYTLEDLGHDVVFTVFE